MPIISACDLSSRFQISLWSAYMEPRYGQTTIFNMASVRHLEFEKLQIFVKNPWWELRCTSAYQISSKSDNSRLRYGDKGFSKWRPSAILNLRKLQFWSRDLYRHVIFHLCSKFRFDRPIWRRDIAKKLFSIWRPSAILNLQNFDFFWLNAHHEN